MLGVYFLLATLGLSAAELEVVYEWPLLKFDTPFNYPRDPAYREDVTFFSGIEVGWDRIFLSFPRTWTGNPATVGWVPRPKGFQSGNASPVIQPYPSWDWHAAAASGNPTMNNCTGIVSVFRTVIDKCNRLWVLDSGVQDSLVTFTVACPPKILIFDLATDQLVRRIFFPDQVRRPNTLFTNMVLDDQTNKGVNPPGQGNCDNVFVYLSDSTNPGIVVYDSARDAAWRLQNPKMFPDPDFGTYNVLGESFTLMDGIIGLALSPAGSYRRTLYFQPFASDRLFSIPTSALQRGPNPGDDADLPVTLVGHKSSQAAPLAVDSRDGSLYFAPVSETAVAAWVPGSPQHRVVAYSPELLQMVLDFRAADRDEGNIWLVSTRFQKLFRRTLNPRETNFRIMRITPDASYQNNTLRLFKK